jgi:hypothetical protein
MLLVRFSKLSEMTWRSRTPKLDNAWVGTHGLESRLELREYDCGHEATASTFVTIQ